MLKSFPQAISKFNIAGIIGQDILDQAQAVTVTNSLSDKEPGSIRLGKPTLVEATHTVALPIDLANGHVYLQGKLANHPLALILDTGATHSYLSRRFLESNQIPHTIKQKPGTQQATGINGQGMSFSVVTVHDLELGTFPLPEFEFSVLTSSTVSDTLGTDGLLGMDFLSGLSRYEIDFQACQLRIVPREL